MHLPTADMVILNALKTHIYHMVSLTTPEQKAGFERIYPKGIDNLSLLQLKTCHSLLHRTVLNNGDRDERI